MIRVLGKGLTAQAIKDVVEDAILYDDNDFDEKYDKNSNDETIVSPGIPPYNNMVINSNNIISDYDYFLKDVNFTIWISGTNGKTTTTQMCQHILNEYGSVYGGNIGTPLAKLDKTIPIWILETSSFTIHYTKKASPNLYILLPISEDHISWHGSFKEYENAKLKAMDNMKEGEVAIIPNCYKDYPTNAYKLCYEDNDDLANRLGIDLNKLNFKEPFLQDAILAMATEKILFDKISYEKINSFVVDKHKLEEFKDNKNRTWIDDSKATNVDATIKGLKNFEKEEIHLILGGDDKGANLEPLFEYISDLNIIIYAIGSNFNRIIENCEKKSIRYYSCETLEKAVLKMDKNIGKMGVGILSPAAASLDQFSSYKHRGEEFKKLVGSLSFI